MARNISARKSTVSDNLVAEDEDDVTPAAKTKTKTKPKLILPANKKVIINDGGYRRRVVTLDEDRKQKLTKKQKTSLAKYKGEQRGKSIDNLFAAIAGDKRRKFGNRAVYIGDQAESLVICIPVPALAFEFLIAQDGFPLGLIFQLVAETGIGKSALLAEFGRWFDMAGGGMELFENETKFNELWYRSIMGRRLFRRTPVNRCKSVEDWQRMLTFTTARWKAAMVGTAEAPGPGRTFPILFGIDSIMGKPSENSAEKILGKMTKGGERGITGDGHASRGYPEEALVITKYLRTYPGEMDNWPFALVLVNHLKMAKDDMGNDTRGKAGGKQVDFQESFELELSRLGGPKKKIQCSDFEGYPVALTCWKNSFGPGQRRIHTRLLWSYVEDEETGGFQQETIWDWDWSTIWLLNNILKGDKADPSLRRSLRATGFHLECPETGEIENSAWSKTLGMAKSDAEPWADLGRRIRRNREVTRLLRNALRINQRALLAGDYLSQLDTLASE